LSAVALSVAGACAAPETRPPIATVADSGGIRIVTARLPDTSDVPEWTLSRQPITSIGGEHVDVPYQFEHIEANLELANGSYAVLEQDGDGGVRIFDSTGRLTATIGRRGGGPGEVANIEAIDVMRGDTILVFDNWRSQLHRFDPLGRFVGSTKLVRPGADSPGAMELPSFEFLGAFPDGSVLITRHPGERRTTPGEIRDDSQRPVRVAPDGKTLADFGTLWRWQLGWMKIPMTRNGKQEMVDGFLPRSRAAVGIAGSHVFYIDPRAGSVSRFGMDGSLRSITRFPQMVAPPDTSGTVRPGGPLAIAAGDKDGTIWWMTSGGSAEGHRYIVIDTMGMVIATARLVSGGQRACAPFTLFIRGDRVTCAVHDSTGVPYVRGYRIVR
jgi:hypothetical protein